MRRWWLGLAGSIAAGLIVGVAATGQFAEISPDLVREPVLQYFTRATTDPVAKLNAERCRAPHVRRDLRLSALDPRRAASAGSYMIYADAFDALPSEARDAIYRRLWQVLSGEEPGARYARFSAADRRAVVEILRDTKENLPAYFEPIGR